MEGTIWDTMDIAKRYPPMEPEKAVGSKPIPKAFIMQFYLDAYDRIRKFLPEEKYVVFHDEFELKAWKEFMREDRYVNVVLDTHQYLMMAEMDDCEQMMD